MNGRVVNTEVLIKSNVKNEPTYIGKPGFSIIELEADDLPVPSFGAIRVTPASDRYAFFFALFVI